MVVVLARPSDKPHFEGAVSSLSVVVLFLLWWLLLFMWEWQTHHGIGMGYLHVSINCGSDSSQSDGKSLERIRRKLKISSKNERELVN